MSTEYNKESLNTYTNFNDKININKSFMENTINLNKKTVIFNIQKFSIHDGPGIRTTVFIKGCPLRCPWCANPESQRREIELTWDCRKCINCKKCTKVFDDESLNVRFVKDSENRFANEAGEVGILPKVDEERAKIFKKVCPAEALSYEGEYKTVEEVITEVLKDKDFFEESGGGMTISGGEGLANPEFALELLKAAKANGIHTAIETTCYCPEPIFRTLIEYVDLLLCDVKHWDSDTHKRVTGVDFDLMDKNISYATELSERRKREGGAPLEIIGRIPVIPGFNYSKRDAEGLRDRLIRLGIKEANLLPYHNFGENKYALLKREYEYEDVKALDKNDEYFKEYKAIFGDLIKNQR